ncbi:glycosyltransferase family 4 protein [Adhaeribacter rhizoryzae]|uniref:Glycosyltransferase family 4 protein n=1 Tax=Adhaeribacter rhizoryzae TaxID=2607907 RepID=A0A5M6DR06_9BACT|nr:glycosyltransferase family 4 protein [Adhaeribacter rhizoryzae]KAA5548776.1 glycosyltransferase family 4 protein [Adhaeribacter rhizoryzae]
MKTPEIISFHPGKQHNLEQAYQLAKSFKNYKHITSLYFDAQTVKFWEKVLPKVGANLKKRSAPLAGAFVDTNPLLEVKMLLKRKLGYKAKNADYLDRNENFQEWIIRNYAPPKICIGYDTSSWVVFEKWKNKSFLVLDLSIAIPQYKLTLAKEYNSDAEFIYNQTKDDGPSYDIYTKELELADLILCGSEFVRDSCLSVGTDPAKLVVLPYGADLNKFSNKESQLQNEGKLKIAFIGAINYRKGADVVLKAWGNIVKEFPQAELHFYGNVQMEVSATVERVVYHGFIHQDSLVQELKTAQISILPSFLEGSSLAIYQSMAMGLAVITTPNTGSIIEHNKNGLLVRYGSVAETTDALRLLLQDKLLRTRLATTAQADIQEYSWDTYGNKLNSLLQSVLQKQRILK